MIAICRCDGLAFYWLQAHFFSIDTEVVYGGLTSFPVVSEQIIGDLSSNARE